MRKLGQRGDGEILLLAAIALLIWGVSGMIGESNRFNTWAQDCRQAKGQIQQTKWGFFEERYECFVDGKQVTLPGWEGY